MDSPAEPVQTGNPKDVYRAYPLTSADRVRLLHQFPPRFSRVIADHISAEGLRSMDKVREGGAIGQVIGVANGQRYQALVVAIDGRQTTSDRTPFHVSWSVEPGFPSGDVGLVIAREGYELLPTPIDIDLSEGPTIRAPLRLEFCEGGNRHVLVSSVEASGAPSQTGQETAASPGARERVGGD